jgi:cyclic pyranopterin phosphate synthase
MREKIPQLRIAVNDTCGKSCAYCRPGGETAGPITGGSMSLDEIVRLADFLGRAGVTNIKLTGGDPALYRDIVKLVHQLKSLSSIERIELVTRHPRAGRNAEKLRAAGLDVLNFSLDSLDPQIWSTITGVRGHEQLIASIKHAANTGIPIKINMVVLRNVNDHEIATMIRFCREIGATLKLLDLIVDVGEYSSNLAMYAERHYDDLARVIKRLEGSGAPKTIEVASGGLGHPMPTFYMKGGPVVQVKTALLGAWYGEICHSCRHFPCHDALMALRLTPDGRLQRCLLRSDNLIDILTPLRAGTYDLLTRRIAKAIATYQSAHFHEHAETAPRVTSRFLHPQGSPIPA